MLFHDGKIPADAVPEDQEQLEGVIDHVVFRNKENGYTVAHLKPMDGSAAVPVVGNFASVNAGMPVTLTGRWVMHPRFGKQFSVSNYKTDIPRSEVGIRKYLTGFIKGVGPVMAKRIVDHFGEDAVSIIEEDPTRLREVPGIGRSKAEKIAVSWREQQRIKDVMMFLQSHNISMGYALKIYQQYGEAAVDVLREDPYVLSSDIFGIGFRIADRIAMNLGMDKDSRVRLRAGLMYVLGEARNEGHVFLPAEKLVAEAVRILEAQQENVEAALAESLAADQMLVEDEGRIYLAPYHFSEKSVATRMAALIAAGTGGKTGPLTADERRSVERGLGFALSGEQRRVMDVLAQEKVVVLTGGPGTGKTVTTKAVIRLFKLRGFRVLLAAPTGRAAKRLSEATQAPACTIHRLLEYKPMNSSFERNEENPLEADLVILDEISMMDTLLMHHFLKAVKTHTRLLLIGDVDQLPSVGAGNILRDLIASERVATVRLSRIFRQQQGSSIIDNAHRINCGDMPSLKAQGPDSNFFFFNKNDPEEALAQILDLCTKRIPKKFRYNPIRDIQVISPMYRGVVGVDNLNKMLQQELNPARDVTCGNHTYRLGDRVMQIKNNYDKEVYNGDVGLVRHINVDANKLFVEFPEHRVEYLFSELDQVVLAYAITVHKSQGTEYPVVVVPMTTHHYPMLQRNLVYTAITRARDMVVIVGAAKAIAIAVKNNKIEERYTALAERIQAALDDKDLFRN